MSINRQLFRTLKESLYKGKTQLIFGARRVGKTHLIKKLVAEEDGIYYNCELLQVRELLDTTNSVALEQLIGNKKLVAFDEAQTIPDIGLKLKIMHDTFPGVQFVATGSSAFELVHATSEPLTGRSRTYFLYPFSFQEIADSTTPLEAYAGIENMLRFGMYPDVFQKSEAEVKEELMNITSNYLYKDILTYGNLKRPDIIYELLKLLAFQIGHEVSINEISNKIDTSVHTIRRYLDMLEKTFVITSLSSLSRNLRNEIGKSKKYYFLDTGIRNAIIQNFNPLSMRNDTGQLWENFCVLERMKKNQYERIFANTYFWRTYDQKEIDYIEERDGELFAYEFKWSATDGKAPKVFTEAYPDAVYQVISKSNFMEFVR